MLLVAAMALAGAVGDVAAQTISIPVELRPDRESATDPDAWTQ